jgi:hypothetical protein
VNPKKEKLIIKYLELTYGDRETFETEKSIGVNGICVYYKNIKKVGFTGEVLLDLNSWFGEGRYYPQLHKWFSNKFDVELK